MPVLNKQQIYTLASTRTHTETREYASQETETCLNCDYKGLCVQRGKENDVTPFPVGAHTVCRPVCMCVCIYIFGIKLIPLSRPLPHSATYDELSLIIFVHFPSHVSKQALERRRSPRTIMTLKNDNTKKQTRSDASGSSAAQRDRNQRALAWGSNNCQVHTH